MEIPGQQNSRPEISQKVMILPHAALMLSSVVPMTARLARSLQFCKKPQNLPSSVIDVQNLLDSGRGFV